MTTESEAQRLWTACATNIRTQVSGSVWQTTFVSVRPLGLQDRKLTVSVPSSLIKERIEGRYLPMVTDAFEEALAGDIELIIEVHTDAEQPELEFTDQLFDPGPNKAAAGANAETAVDQAEQAGDTHPKYTFETFVTGPSNRFAHAAALAVAETPAKSYNPLFVYGDAGLGKTHLLQSIAHYVGVNYPQYTVRYVSTETFLNEFVDAIQHNTRAQFKKRYREVDVLLVDDIQFMETREGLQEEFFHTFNTLHQANKQLVLSSDRPPDAMSTLEDRLRSRFKMGLITDIQPPDLETRLAIMRKKAESESAAVPHDVLEFIASHITDNIRVLEGALIRVCAYASLTGEELGVPMAEQVLSDVLSAHQPHEITSQLILDATSARFGFSVEEIIGARRQRPLVTARQIAMYLVRELTDLSYPAIARDFGGRDHTTVIHAVDKISTLMSERRQIYDQVTALTQTLKTGDRPS